MTEFKTTLDGWAKGCTVGMAVLFGLSFFIEVPSLPIVISIVYVAAFLFAPFKYTLTNTQLIIHCRIRKVIIERSDISEVKLLTDGKIGYSLRTFGVGGLFGYYGYFYNAAFGTMRCYLTRTDNVLLLITNNDRKIAISPDQIQDFIAELNR